MKSTTQKHRPRKPPLCKGGALRRSAFTLVEMMVVVVIIAILAGLIVPALRKAMITANEARVITEIRGLESAIAAFKAKYGCEPPSRFSLYLTQAGWSNDPTNTAIVRQIWPQFDFKMGDPNGGTAGAGTAYPSYWTLAPPNGPNVNNANVINMNSGECLLFFLGGVIQVQGANQLPQGFAKNPAYPFSPPAVSANREGPFFEFTAVDRIKDIDGNGMNEFYDALPNQSKPYLYFSSYEGRGYNTLELPNNGTTFTYMQDMYRIWSGTVSSTSFPLPPSGPQASTAGTSAALPAQKAQSFQIISPGYDGNYGVGGVFNINLNNSGLIKSFSGTTPVYDTDAYDNLTNFNGGRLKP